MTIHDQSLDTGEVADVAIEAIQDLLDRFNLKPTSDGFEALWEDLYSAVSDIEVQPIK